MPMRPVQVGTGSTQVAPFNPRRKSLVIFNVGSETIYVSNDKSITTANGIPIVTGGFIAAKEIDGDEPWYEWNAISPTTTNDVRVFEGYGESPAV